MTDPVDAFLSLVSRAPSLILRSNDEGLCFVFESLVCVSLYNDGVFRLGDDAVPATPLQAACWVNQQFESGDEY